jgi:hypothetical protein
MKKNHGGGKARTHFEQVPLEIVKKIATGPPKAGQAGSRDVTIEPPSKKASGMRAGSLALDGTPPSTGWPR